MFRSRRTALLSGLATFCVTGACLAFLAFTGAYFSPDFALSDRYHRRAVRYGLGPGNSERIAYLTLSDETYRRFDRNVLDRAWLARVNRSLHDAESAAVAYDIIFARSAGSTAEDATFARSIRESGRVFLPMGFALCDDCSLRDTSGLNPALSENARARPAPRLDGPGRALSARRGIFQLDAFARAAAGMGHVSAPADSDRVVRHFAMVVRANDVYVPGLALALYLDELGLTMADLEIHWGRHIRIPPRPERGLERERLIPIDERGRAYVPFAGVWNDDFPQMRAEELLRHASDPGLAGNLADFFGDRFVFIGDVSSGAADAADTPLEGRVPLVALHAHLLNALFTGDFYRRLTTRTIVFGLLISAFFLGFAASLRRAYVFYLTMAILCALLFFGGWWGHLRFTIVPVMTVFFCLLAIFAGTLVALRIGLSRERTAGLQRLNTELLAIKSHLEDLVGERTRDLKASLDQIESDLDIARHVQQKILPGLDLDLSGIEYHYEYQPLDRVGGDLIDIAEIRPGVIRIFLADAVGHGVQASLLTMAVNSEYQELKADFDEPHRLMIEYNRRLIAKYNMRLFTYIPCFLADLHVNEGKLLHASGGMPDQYCQSPGQAPVCLEHTGPAIGFMKTVKIDTVSTDFPPGARILIYSDGVTEIHNAAGDMFGEEGVAAAMTEKPGLPPRAMIDELLRRTDEFRRGHRVLDDLTVLALCRKIGDG